MVRIRPQTRLADLVEATSEAFIRGGGYRRTQMADVAKAMGVAAGTLYLYVESKEALFDFTVRCLNEGGVPDPEPELPIPTPAPGETVAYIGAQVTRRNYGATLEAVKQSNTQASQAELEAIIGEIFDLIYGRRRLSKFVDICARSYPGLADVWYTNARMAFLEDFVKYLERGIREGVFRPMPDVALAARAALEVVATWALHQEWDPIPLHPDADTLRETVVRFATGAFLIPKS